MRRVEPEVYLIGESKLDHVQIRKYLVSVGGKDWHDKNQSSGDGSETLAVVMGRLCYKSWEVGLNKNVTKIREGNDIYLKNILASGHGSVLEHGSTNWIIQNCSRVFTHELVRHRAGTAFSQESLRYVRGNDLGLWLPSDPVITPERIARYEKKFRYDEEWYEAESKDLGLDDPGRNFEYKKKWTSFLRRFLPQGMATEIGVTINFRALRHVIAMRTAPAAEVEIRVIFDKIATIAKEKWPNLMQDFKRSEDGAWTPEFSKV